MKKSNYRYASLNVDQPPLANYGLERLFRYADKDVLALVAPGPSATAISTAAREMRKQVEDWTLQKRVMTPNSGPGVIVRTATSAGQWRVRLDAGAHRQYAWATLAPSLPPFPSA